MWWWTFLFFHLSFKSHGCISVTKSKGGFVCSVKLLKTMKLILNDWSYKENVL